MLYTHQLVIETILIKVKLVVSEGCDIGRLQVPIKDVDFLPSELVETISERFEVAWLEWEIEITPIVVKGSQLDIELHTETIECATMFGHSGLLLRTQKGVSERIGSIPSLDATFRCPDVCSSYAKDWEVTEQLPHRVRCLANHFPTRKGHIRLQ
jgi:hypothetical protein